MEDPTGMRGMGGQTGMGEGSGGPATQRMGDQTGLRGMCGQTGGGVYWGTSPGWVALPDTLSNRVRTL